MKRLILPATIITSLFIFSGCEKDEPVILTPLAEFLSANQELSIFSSALDKAGLQSFKTGAGPFTWFAPSNTAFTAAGLTLDSINRMSPGAVNYLLMYHLVNASFTSLDMIANNSFPRGTQLGNTGTTQVFIGRRLPDYYVNGTKISSIDNIVANGVVHIIDKVNIPPNLVGNVQGILTASGQHTLFIAALTRANRWAALAGSSIFTMLAPTDAAMTAEGYTIASIAATPVTRMDSVVRYHFFNNLRLFSNDFNNGNTPQTALGPGKTIAVTNNGTKLKGPANVTPVNVTVIDKLGVNGVVHHLDGVLKY